VAAGAVEARELRKVFGDTVAVDRLSLSVARGEVFGFLGPNGAGKTTTVNLLLDLVRPTSGEALILGRPPGDPDTKARVGFLPEHFRFPSWLTATGFLHMHSRLMGLPAAKRRALVPEVLERVGLADRGSTKLGAFSKGMTQRIGLAQAILGEPELVFLDEPTSALDPLGRREVRDIIRELRDKGVTVFLNSHLLSEVEVTCDRVAIVKDGAVVRTGTLDELTGAAVELDVTADGLTPELVAGLERWGATSRQSERRITVILHGRDDVPAVADWLVRGGASLHALEPRRASLEEMFVHIVGDQL